MIKIKVRNLIKIAAVLLLSINLINTNVKAVNVKFKDYNFKKSIENQTMCSSGYINDEFLGYTEFLYFNEENIWSLEGIQNFYNLKNLVLENTNIADLTPISNLKNIENLSITNSAVTDLTAIKRLTSLKTLTCTNLNLENYSAIGQLTNLESLTLDNCDISDLSFLKNLKHLKYLSLADNYIKDISVLKELNNLGVIDLANNFISDISSLLNISYQSKIEINDITYDSKITIDDNLLNLNENNNVVINQLKGKGINVTYEPYKDKCHPVKINQKRDTSINIIDSTIDLTIEYNESLEGKTLYVGVTDAKEEGSPNAETRDINYRIDGNNLIINSKDLFKQDDMNIISILHEDYNLEMFLLQKSNFIKGDSNNDGIVNLEDLTEAAKDYNKTSKDSDTWNIHEDTNKDGIIDIYDISYISSKLN